MEMLPVVFVSAATGAAVAYTIMKYQSSSQKSITDSSAAKNDSSAGKKKASVQQHKTRKITQGPVDAIFLETIELNNIPSLDIGSESDPYVIITREDGKTYKSATINNAVNCTIPISMVLVDGKSEVVQFTVMDADIGGDDIIGTFELKIEGVWNDLKKESVKLVRGKLTPHTGVADTCTIALKLRMIPWANNYENPTAPTNMCMDIRTRAIWEAVKAVRQEAKATKIEASQLALPREKRPITLQRIASGAISIPVDDDQVPVSGFLQRTVADKMINTKIVDVDTPMPSRSEAINYVTETMQPYIPIAVDGYYDRTTDEAFKLMFTQGVGGSLLVRTENGFESDFNSLKNYETRKPYLRPHGKIHWDHDINPVDIELNDHTIRPGDAEWEHAKFVLRSTATQLITVREHLLWGHFIWANYTSASARENLSATHPVRRLIHPHTYRTHNINDTSSYTLVGERGLLAREDAWPKPTLDRMFVDIIGAFQYELFPDRLKRQKIHDLSEKSLFVHDSLAYRAIYENYVHGYLSTFYKNESELENDPEVKAWWAYLHKYIPHGLPSLTYANVAGYLTEFIFQVTGYHFHNGHVISYMLDPSYRTGKITEGAVIASREAFELPIMVSLSTDMDMPMVLQDWHHILPDQAQHVYHKLQDDLKAFSHMVETRNQTREPFDTFNPKHHHLAISV